MRRTEIQGFIIEIDQICRRQEALRELLKVRTRTLRESLRQRVMRARQSGDWISLTPEECAILYQQEQTRLREQVQRLRAEHQQTRALLSKLKRAKTRAERARAAETATHKKLR